MLLTQQLLRNGHTLDHLFINIKKHEVLPLSILHYNQYESPKFDPIVMECRGLVLHTNTWDLVARAFPRFFNWGEITDPEFDFSDFSTTEKLDGSLILIYWFDGEWRCNTKNSFADQQIPDCQYTWRDLVCQALGFDLSKLDLDRSFTYVCELCSPYTKVVRQYNQSELYLLTKYCGEEEVCPVVADFKCFRQPHIYSFKGIEQIIDYLERIANIDPTFEGVVIKDTKHRRFKVKSPKYLRLHKIKSEGFTFKSLLPFILKHESDELFAYFPEAKTDYQTYERLLTQQFHNLLNRWIDCRDLPTQKEFALSVIDHPYSALLFNIKKRHPLGGIKELQVLWENSFNLILKHNKGTR